MADKLTEFIDKSFKPLINFIGKNKVKNENITGIVLGDTDIQLCSLKKKKEGYAIEEYSYQKINGIGQDQDIYSASTFLSDQIKNALSSIKLKSTDVAISLPNRITTTYNLQIPIMDPKDLEDSVALGGFWEQFDQTPDTLEGTETSYKLLSSNEELGVMDVLLFTAETKLIEAYMNIFRLAGVNPVVADINSNNQFNALVPAFGKEGFDQPVAIFNYTKDSSYIAVTSAKGFQMAEINIVEADEVLLDTVEEVEDVLNEFWDEIFERLGSQLKQALVEFETKYEVDPIAIIYLFTDQRKVTNLSAGLAKYLGEVIIKEYDPEESIEIDSESKKYLDSLSNKSLSGVAIGSALRKLNAFNVPDATDEIFKFNFVPNLSRLITNRKSTASGKTFFSIGFLVLFLGLGHLVPFNILKIIDNSDTISKNSADLQDYEQKQTMLKVYDGKIKKVQSEVFELQGLGENKKTTTEIVSNLIKVVPENIRLTSFQIKDKKSIIIEGVSKDDASVTQMVNSFTNEKSIQEAKLDSFASITSKDMNELYQVKNGTPLKQEEIPKEDISKKFTLVVAMKPVENETFDNTIRLGKLIKSGSKRKK